MRSPLPRKEIVRVESMVMFISAKVMSMGCFFLSVGIVDFGFVMSWPHSGQFVGVMRL